MAQTDKRQCASCGAPDMAYGRQNVSRDFEGAALTILDVTGWFCSACGELEFDSPESARSFLEQVTALQRQRRSTQASSLNRNVTPSVGPSSRAASGIAQSIGDRSTNSRFPS